jgi:hypothetical protein
MENTKNTDETTNNFLMEQGPYYHITLFHHHEITAKANEVETPTDETMVTFDYPDGSSYNITYGKLKNYAKTEQEQFINDNQ